MQSSTEIFWYCFCYPFRTCVGFERGVFPVIPYEGCEVIECWVCSEVQCGEGVMAEFAEKSPSIITILEPISGVYIKCL